MQEVVGSNPIGSIFSIGHCAWAVVRPVQPQAFSIPNLHKKNSRYQALSFRRYSWRNATMGSTLAARIAGYNPKIIPTPSSIVQDHPIMDNPAEILFTAGAGDVVIRYQGPDGGCPGCQAFFNGFELYATGPTVGFESDASGGIETINPALINVVLTNAEAGGTYTVDYAATGGTAVGDGNDYTLEPDTLTFTPGETSKYISIDIVDDGAGEPDETIILTLSNPTGPNAVMGISQHTYTISDYLPDVSFDAVSSSDSEAVTPAEISVSLSHASDLTTTVDYAVTGGDATGGGVAYTLLGSGTLTFEPYVTTQYISLSIVDDSEIEAGETVELTLSNPGNASLGTTTVHTYTILDNEQGVVWDGLTWFYSGNPADFFVNGDGDLEWTPQGGEQFMARIGDVALSQVGYYIEKSYMWMTDGAHDCPDCFACPDGCYDNDITCIAGTSDMRFGMYEADGEWVEADGFSVTSSSIFTGYKGYNFRFGPNMKAGPTRWVDCLDEVHKTGNFAKKPQSSSNLMYTNDGLAAYIPGFELTPGEYSLFVVRLERTGSSSIEMTITLNGRTYSDTDGSSSEQPSKIDVLAVHMRNHRPYTRLVLRSLTAPDTTAPSPDPMTWETVPYATGDSSISMTATAAYAYTFSNGSYGGTTTLPSSQTGQEIVVQELIGDTFSSFNHASSIAEANDGTLVACWYGGSSEGAADVSIWVCTDNGNGWTPRVEVDDGDNTATWNPVLFQPSTGPMLLYYKYTGGPSSWVGCVKKSYDGGQSWSSRILLPTSGDSYLSAYGGRFIGPVKNKPIELPDGTLLCGSSTEDSGWRVHMEIAGGDYTNDFTLIGPISGADAIQPTFLVHDDDYMTIEALCRASGSGSPTPVTWSYDGGQSWSDLTTISHNTSKGLHTVTINNLNSLKNRYHIMAYNPSGRYPLRVATSTDGTNWDVTISSVDDSGGDMDYPTIMQGSDKMLHLTYSWGGHSKIGHVVIDPYILFGEPRD